MDYIKDMSPESDRGCALVAAAHIDETDLSSLEERDAPFKTNSWASVFCRRAFLVGALLARGASGQPGGIGVRVSNGAGELYNRQTGATFTPRGNNFVRLAQQSNLDGGTVVYHSTFNAGDYNSTDVESNLSLMQMSGYNTVRVFLDDLAIGNSTGGLSSSYLDNVADFLARTERHSLYAIFTIDSAPGTAEYNTLLYSSCCTSFNGINLQYLTAGGIQADQKFWRAFIEGLQSRNVPLGAVLAYELRNELFFDETNPPLSLPSGTVTTANGQSYDMSSAAGKQQMMDDNLVYWINSVRSAALEADPTALVSIGFFEPQRPNPVRIGDPRSISTQPAIVSSQADIIDLHPYLDTGLTLPQLVQNFGMPAVSAKPIVMGEFGATQASFTSAATAAQQFQQWQVQSCQYGFSGWLLWTWDTMAQPGTSYWSALSEGGVIDSALNPTTRPNACQSGLFLEQNLALGATASASASMDGNGPQLAVDGLTGTDWNSGGFPPQWIRVDLPHPSIVNGIRLAVSQSPSGPTVHDLYVQIEGGTPQLLTEFDGITQDQQTLTWTASQPLVGVTSISIDTVAGPSWVAWREIEILSGDAGQPMISSVLNGASFDAAVTPGSWVAIYGTDLAASTRTWQASDFSGTQLPTVLDGVSVSIDGAPASVYYISPTQLNVQAPSPIHTGQAVVVKVGRDNVQATGSIQTESKVDDPALFAYTASGSLYAAAVFADGTIVGDPTKTPNTRGATPGDYVSLYGTGFGASPSGVVINSPATLSSPVQVAVGGQPAAVEFAGLVGVGLFQINIVVPNLPVGDYPVTVQFQGATGATAPNIPIR